MGGSWAETAKAEQLDTDAAAVYRAHTKAASEQTAEGLACEGEAAEALAKETRESWHSGITKTERLGEISHRVVFSKLQERALKDKVELEAMQ